MTRHFYVYQIESIYFDMPISIALKAINNFLFLETLKYLQVKCIQIQFCRARPLHMHYL